MDAKYIRDRFVCFKKFALTIISSLNHRLTQRKAQRNTEFNIQKLCSSLNFSKIFYLKSGRNRFTP